MEEEERCVYVKESVLSQIEIEKKELKWKLSKATKSVESRSAEIAAYESKIKDLLTIIEMNKNVAENATKKNYIRESDFYQLQQEKLSIQIRLDQLQKRILSQGFHSLRKRVLRKKLKECFLQWNQFIESIHCFRHSIRLIEQTFLKQQHRLALSRWRRRVFEMDCLIKENHGCQLEDAIKSGWSFLFRMRLKMRHQKKQLCFRNWKVWSLTRIQTRDIKLNSFSAAASRKLSQSFFVAWKQYVGVLSRKRRSLRYMTYLLQTKVLQRYFHRLRIQSMLQNVTDWTSVLQSAQQALEEEKKEYRKQQLQVMENMTDGFEFFQVQHAKRISWQVERVYLLKQLILKQRIFYALSVNMRERQQQLEIAQSFANRRLYCLKKTFSFNDWKAKTKKKIKLVRWNHHLIQKKESQLLRESFKAFVSFHQTFKQQRYALQHAVKAIILPKIKQRLLQKWYTWRHAVFYMQHEQQMNTTTELYRVQCRQNEESWHTSLQWSKKHQRKLQVEIALRQQDIHHVRLLYRVFLSWYQRTKKLQRQHLLLDQRKEKRRAEVLRLYWVAWIDQVQVSYTKTYQIHQLFATRQYRSLRDGFVKWKKHFQQSKCLQYKHELLETSTKWTKMEAMTNRLKTAVLRHFLHIVRIKMVLRPVFHRLNLLTRIVRTLEFRRAHLKRQVWHIWTRYLNIRMQQHRAVAHLREKRYEQNSSFALKQIIWRAWFNAVQASKQHTTFYMIQQQRQVQHERFIQWCDKVHQNQLLRKIINLYIRKRLTHALTTWRIDTITQTIYANVASEGRYKLVFWLLWTSVTISTNERMKRVFVAWKLWTRQQKQRRSCNIFFHQQKNQQLLLKYLHQWFKGISILSTTKKRVLTRLVRARLKKNLETAWQLLSLHATHVEIESRTHQSASESHRKMLDKLFARVTVHLCTVHMRYYLKAVFDAWKNEFSFCSKTQKQCLIAWDTSIFQRKLRHGWIQWKMHTLKHKKYQQAREFFQKKMIRKTWRIWLQRAHHSRAFQFHVSNLVQVLTKRLKRLAWTQWERFKWQHLHTAYVYQTARCQIQDICFRLEKERQLIWIVWIRWKQFVVQNERFVLVRIWQRHLHRQLKNAFLKWKTKSISISFESKLNILQNTLQIQKKQFAKRYVMVLITNWQKPCIEKVFHQWKYHVQISCPQKIEKAKQLQAKHLHFLSLECLTKWKQYTKKNYSLRVKSMHFMRNQQQYSLEICMVQWKQNVFKRCTMRFHLTKIFTLLKNKSQRRVFNALKENALAKWRRQSIQVLVQAQQQIKIHKKQVLQQKMFFLLTKQHKSLVKQIIENWKMYTKQAQHTLEVINKLFQKHETQRKRHLWYRWWHLVDQKKISKQLFQKYQRGILRKCWLEWQSVVRDFILIRKHLKAHFLATFRHLTYQAFIKWQKFIGTQKIQVLQLSQQKIVQQQMESHLQHVEVLKKKEICLKQKFFHFALQKIFVLMFTKKPLENAFFVWKNFFCIHQMFVCFSHGYQRVFFKKWQKQMQNKKIQHFLLIFIKRDVLKFFFQWKKFITKNRKKKFFLQKKNQIKLLKRNFYKWKKMYTFKHFFQSKIFDILLLKTYFSKWKKNCIIKCTKKKKKKLYKMLLKWQFIQKRHSWIKWQTFVIQTKQIQWQNKILSIQMEQKKMQQLVQLETLKRRIFLGWYHWIVTNQWIRQVQCHFFKCFEKKKKFKKSFSFWKRISIRHTKKRRIKQMQKHTRCAPLIRMKRHKATILPTLYSISMISSDKCINDCLQTFSSYQKLIQSQKRIAINRLIFGRRRHQQNAFKILSRVFVRQIFKLKKNVFLLWFSRTQEISKAFAECITQYHHGKFSTHRPNLKSALLHLLLNELNMLQCAFDVEKKKQALVHFAYYERNHKQVLLRNAFHHLSSLTRQAHHGLRYFTRLISPSRRNQRMRRNSLDVALARAFLERIDVFMTRYWFTKWKNHYIQTALALAEAQEKQLLLVLRCVNSEKKDKRI